MITETLIRHKVRYQEIIDMLGLPGEISHIQDDHAGHIIIECLIKGGE